MTPDEVLVDLWERADATDANDALFGIATIVDWPDGMLDALQACGVVEEAEPATTVTCDACDDAHWPEVVLPRPGRGTADLGHYYCPESGWQEVALEALRQWRISLRGIASAIAHTLGTGRSPREEVPGYIWRLGRLDSGERLLPVLLVRTTRAAAPWAAPLGRLLDESTLPPVVFTVAPAADLTPFGSARVLALPDVAVWRDERVQLDLRVVVGPLSDSVGQTVSGDVHELSGDRPPLPRSV